MLRHTFSSFFSFSFFLRVSIKGFDCIDGKLYLKFNAIFFIPFVLICIISEHIFCFISVIPTWKLNKNPKHSYFIAVLYNTKNPEEMTPELRHLR